MINLWKIVPGCNVDCQLIRLSFFEEKFGIFTANKT